MFICVLNESLPYKANIKINITHLVMVILKNYLSDFDMYLMEQVVTTFVPTLPFGGACLRVFEVHS